MSTPFSFPSLWPPDATASPVPASSVPGGVRQPTEPSASTPLFEEAPLTAAEPHQDPQLPVPPPSESLFFRPIPYMPPLGVSPGSALSGALQGRPPERQMPPPNRRPAPPAPASMALNGAAPPTPSPTWPPGQISSREISQLRLEVREELEQVKNDLFGAATGVSALKDRLDGLEQATAKAGKSAAPRLEELQAWIDERIDQAVRTAVARAFEAALGGGGEAARTATRPPQQDPPTLSEAPVVLSSSPS